MMRKTIRRDAICFWAAVAMLAWGQPSEFWVSGFTSTTTMPTGPAHILASRGQLSATLVVEPETAAKEHAASGKNRSKSNHKSKGKSTKSQPRTTRADRRNAYMKRRWGSQQAAARRRKQAKKGSNNNDLVSVVGLNVGSIRENRNKGNSHHNNGSTKSNPKRAKSSPAMMSPPRQSVSSNNKKSRRDTAVARDWQSWEDLEPGMKISGRVKKVLPYGAVIQTYFDIPSPHNNHKTGQALLYAGPSVRGTENDDTSEALRPGQRLDNLCVLTINRAEGKVKLSWGNNNNNDTQRRATPLPASALSVGDELQGKIVRLKQYGAFVDIGCKRNALLHVSRLTLYRVQSITDHVNVGDVVKVRVLRLETEEGSNSNNKNEKGTPPRRIKNIAVSMLSPENDEFVDRRDLQRRRMDLWQKVVQTDEADLSLDAYKKELLDLDRRIWSELEDGAPKTLEV